MEYGFPQAVADGVNVDFDVFRSSTAISEQGSTIEAGYVTPSGHSTVNIMLNVYSHVSPSMHAEAANLVADLFLGPNR